MSYIIDITNRTLTKIRKTKRNQASTMCGHQGIFEHKTDTIHKFM
jgi:hypothetical protein